MIDVLGKSLGILASDYSFESSIMDWNGKDAITGWFYLDKITRKIIDNPILSLDIPLNTSNFLKIGLIYKWSNENEYFYQIGIHCDEVGDYLSVYNGNAGYYNFSNGLFSFVVTCM